MNVVISQTNRKYLNNVKKEPQSSIVNEDKAGLVNEDKLVSLKADQVGIAKVCQEQSSQNFAKQCLPKTT